MSDAVGTQTTPEAAVLAAAGEVARLTARVRELDQARRAAVVAARLADEAFEAGRKEWGEAEAKLMALARGDGSSPLG